jgi:hypothetical protein
MLPPSDSISFLFFQFLKIDCKELTMSKVSKLTKEQFLAAVQGSGGLVGTMAGTLGVDRETIERAMQKWPEVSEAFQMESEELLDLAERNIHQAIKAGDVEVSRWYLERKGRERGYGQQISASNDHQSDGQFGLWNSEDQ